ncbi:hypothetical protein AJ78_02549 [Emergomyces pasteurianus Ep9510]|uniref:HypA-like protein n=1 Tax=Emergomyces pasteurianus Ep9510 TaxID=1447872 RepID=A0A1J9QNC3_9EURO|nr:hypothetical protein AJ78_02549 [Emergomyces pasteurianus Ep9510]
MATATHIEVSSNDTGILGLRQNADSAKKASETLQADMERYHVFYNNDKGFHNHLAHHILTTYSLGASPDAIQSAFDRTAAYQLPRRPVDEAVVQKLGDKSQFHSFAGIPDQYPNFLAYFQRQIDSKGVESVVNEYLFAGDERADDMLVRLFAGIIHPFIQLGFGLEFNQPAIVAEALAETAVHELNLTFLLPAEEAAGGVGMEGKKSLVQLQQEIRSNTKLRESVRWEDANKINGMLARAPEEIIKIVSQFSVGPGQLEQRLAELFNAVAYFAGAAQRPQKRIKFDFFYMHCVTSTIFLASFVSQPWISIQNKLRILEWKGRVDLMMYASRGAAELRREEITNYEPKLSWEEVFAQAINHPREDGHASKFVRTLAYGEKLCKQFELDDRYREAFLVRGDMWIKLANMGEFINSGGIF